jgi:hypothetical protein
MNMRKNLIGERLEEVAENYLIPGNLGVVVGVGRHLGSLVRAQISQSNDNHLCGSSI